MIIVCSIGAVFTWVALHEWRWEGYLKVYQALCPFFPYGFMIPAGFFAQAVFFRNEYGRYQRRVRERDEAALATHPLPRLERQVLDPAHAEITHDRAGGRVQIVHQGRQNDLHRIGAHLQEFDRASPYPGTGRLQRGDHVHPEPHRVVVGLIKRQPAESLVLVRT